jgi:hypothetical protein
MVLVIKTTGGVDDTVNNSPFFNYLGAKEVQFLVADFRFLLLYY